MDVPCYIVDAFTEQPFRGNPAGVCLLDGPAPVPWMAAVAAELRHSETAFCWPGDGRDFAAGCELRWYTPLVEVPLCGHATLATAHVLWSSGRVAASTPLQFSTRSGPLVARTRPDVGIALDFPTYRDSPVTAEVASAAARVVGATPRAVVSYAPKLLVELDSEEAVAAVSADREQVRALEGEGLLVTAASVRPDVDYVLRYFAPNAGVDEDPVTGSAQSAAGPYWAARLGRRRLRAEQISARRGALGVEVSDDGARVTIAGRATTVLTGALHCGPTG